LHMIPSSGDLKLQSSIARLNLYEHRQYHKK